MSRNVFLKGFVLMFLITACGTDDSGSEVSTVQGFSEVSEGTYSVFGSDLSYECTNGETGTTGGDNGNMEVRLIEKNQIILASENRSYAGTMRSDGYFRAFHDEELTDRDLGRLVISRSISGSFSNDTLQADFLMTIYFADFGETCEYTGTLDAELL